LSRSDSARKELSKDISSFANSAGGTIIYGVYEGEGPDAHLPAGIDEGCSPQDITREWLENVIHSSIRPRIESLRIRSLTLESGNLIFVVYIPQSSTGPHMASDNRYYKRYNFRSVPMEDYEVRDVLNRSTSPALEMQFLLDNIPVIPGTRRLVGDAEELKKPLKLKINVVNTASVPAEYVVYRVLLGDGIEVVRPPQGFTKSEGVVTRLLWENDLHGLLQSTQYSMNHGIPSRMPIWSGITWEVGQCDIRLPEGRVHSIGYEVLSPKMRPRSGNFGLINKGQELKVVDLRPEHLSVAYP